MQQKTTNILVGVFMMLGLLGLLFLAIKVSGMSVQTGQGYYTLAGDFDNIGSLKVRQPVRVAGVTIGQVSDIVLNQDNYTARVYMSIAKRYRLPTDTQASIMTEGVLGSKYMSITPGYEESMLQDGDSFVETHSALILEDAIGKFLFNSDNKEK